MGVGRRESLLRDSSLAHDFLSFSFPFCQWDRGRLLREFSLLWQVLGCQLPKVPVRGCRTVP